MGYEGGSSLELNTIRLSAIRDSPWSARTIVTGIFAHLLPFSPHCYSERTADHACCHIILPPTPRTRTVYVVWSPHWPSRSLLSHKKGKIGASQDHKEVDRRRNTETSLYDRALRSRWRTTKIDSSKQQAEGRCSRNETALYPGLFLPYFVLVDGTRERAAFVHLRSPVLLGSDQITGHEALYPGKCGFPLHRIGDVRGLGVTTSAAIPASFQPCIHQLSALVLFLLLYLLLFLHSCFCFPVSLSLRPYPEFTPIVLFLVNTRFVRTSFVSPGTELDSAHRMGFSRERTAKEDARKRSCITIILFFGRNFSVRRRKTLNAVRDAERADSASD